MAIKRAYIKGTLQDWDIHDYRFDIERVYIDVPPEVLAQFSDEEIADMEYEGCCNSDDDKPLCRLLEVLAEKGLFVPSSRWEFEDPCDLMLYAYREEGA